MVNDADDSDAEARRTTIKRAKAAYKAIRGARRISEQEQRKLEREVEREKAAEAFRDQEKRAREAQKKREERLKKEQAARKQLGIGLATQLAGYSHTQKRMKSGMEAFLGLKKRQAEPIAAPTVAPAPAIPTDVPDVSMANDIPVLTTEIEEPTKDDEILNQLMEDIEADAENKLTQPPKGNLAPRADSGHIRSQPDTKMNGASQRQAKRKHSESVEDMDDLWAGVFASNTQLTRELSQNDHAAKRRRRSSTSPLPPGSIEAIKANMNNKGDRIPSFNTNYGSDITEIWDFEAIVSTQLAKDIIVRDFAYPVDTPKTIINKADAILPPAANSGIAPMNSMISSYHQFGLSTQVLTEAFADSDYSDTDEDSDTTFYASYNPEQRPVSPWRAPAKSVFKPPVLPTFAPSTFSEFGLSTQLLADAVEDDVRLSPVADRRKTL